MKKRESFILKAVDTDVLKVMTNKNMVTIFNTFHLELQNISDGGKPKSTTLLSCQCSLRLISCEGLVTLCLNHSLEGSLDKKFLIKKISQSYFPFCNARPLTPSGSTVDPEILFLRNWSERDFFLNIYIHTHIQWALAWVLNNNIHFIPRKDTNSLVFKVKI